MKFIRSPKSNLRNDSELHPKSRSSRRAGLLFSILLLIGLSIANLFASGDADPAFDPNVSAVVYSTAIQPDGRIVIGGDFFFVGGVQRNGIARLNANGSLDPAFNPNVNGVVYTAAVLVDGKIVIGGDFTSVGGVTRNGIARLNPDGSVDPAFNPNSNDALFGMAVQPDGKIIVTGQFTFMGGVARNFIARLNPDGTVDLGFNPNADNSVFSAALQPDGKIVIGGDFTGVGGFFRSFIARLNADGTTDPAFNPSANNRVSNAAIQSDGRIVIGGAFTAVGGFIRNFIARLNPDGSADFSYNPDASSFVYSTSLQADGRIVMGGDFLAINGVFRGGVARLNQDGTLDQSLFGASENTIFNTALQGDGGLLVGGFFTNVGGMSRNGFARLLNDIATQSLTVPSSNRVQWLRGGTAPEFGQVSFELSTDGGVNWTLLGPGTRIAGGWERTGLTLPASGLVRARGRVIMGSNNSSSGIVEQLAPFAPATAPPVATTGAANGISGIAATFNGTVDPNGASTNAHFEYGVTTSYGSSVDVAPAPGSGDDPVAVSATIGDLLPNQSYHFRLVAANSAGTGTGNDMTFSTLPIAPTVTTNGAGNLATDRATINGTINPNGSTVTNAVVEYGTTTSYGTSVNVAPSPGGGRNPVAVSAMLTGLVPNQVYHFRVTATNSAGTSSGTDGTFTAGVSAASVITGAPTSVSPTGATITGTVNPNGSATTAAFEYGATTDYGSIAPVVPDPGSGAAAVNVSVVLTGLVPNQTYHYRLTANSNGGLVTGSDATFTTAAVLPSVATDPAMDVTGATATLRGTVNPNGSPTTARFVFRKLGATNQQTTTIENVGNGTNDVALEAMVTDLDASTDYEFRLEATSAAGTKLGEFLSFKTSIATLGPMPDRVFAAISGAEFPIDVLANDSGTGLFITNVIQGEVGPRAVRDGTQSINFTPVDRTRPDTVSEMFSYRVRDVRNDPQFEGEAAVTVQYFTPLRGTYYGNFSAPGGRVFRLRMDLDFAGSGSGRFEWEDEQYPFKVQFDHQGQAQIAKARDGENFVSLRVSLALDPAAMVLTGTFEDEGANPETLAVTLQFLPPNLNNVPDNGTVIAFIDPGETGTGASLTTRGGTAKDDAPEGIGFTRIKIKKGRARFTTKMPDFGTFSVGKQRVQPTDGLVLPRYALGNRKIKRKGSGQVGSINGDAFTGRGQTGTDRIYGALNWLRNRSTGGSQPLIALVEGFRYTRPSLSPVPPGFPTGGTSNARIRLKGGGLQDEIKFDASLNRNTGKAAATESSPVVLGLNMKLNIKSDAGIVSGSFIHPVTGQKVKISAGIGGEPGFSSNLAIKEPRIRGSFFDKSTKRAGRITVTPK